MFKIFSDFYIKMYKIEFLIQNLGCELERILRKVC